MPGTRVLVPDHECIVPGYEGISAGVRGYMYRGTSIKEPRYEGIKYWVRRYIFGNHVINAVVKILLHR